MKTVIFGFLSWTASVSCSFVPGKSCGILTPIKRVEGTDFDISELEPCTLIVEKAAYSKFAASVSEFHYTPWSVCSATCGGGTMSRTRECRNKTAVFEPQVCGSDVTELTMVCNTHLCTEWNTWQDWSSCSKSCEEGIKTRARDCRDTIANVIVGDKHCKKGNKLDTDTCTILPICPVDGSWSDWGPWASCSLSCGYAGGTRTRMRTCDNPQPVGIGMDCQGNNTDSEAGCNQKVDCTTLHILVAGTALADDISTSPAISAPDVSLVSAWDYSRTEHVGAVLHDGILICGGMGASKLKDCRHLIMGSANSYVHSTMQVARNRAAGIMKGDQLWITGGMDGNNWWGKIKSTELLDPATRTWSFGPDLPEPSVHHCIVALSPSQYLFMGGENTGAGTKHIVNTAKAYNWDTGAWTWMASMNQIKRSMTCGIMDVGGVQTVIVAGGFGNGQYLNTVEKYNVAANQWSWGPALPNARLESRFLALGGKLLLFGGTPNWSSYYDDVLELSEDASGWTERTDLQMSGGGLPEVVMTHRHCDTCAKLTCFEDPVDYAANGIDNMVTATAEICKGFCQQLTSCKAFTFRESDKMCHRKTSDAGRQTLAGHVSGLRTCGCLQDGVDFKDANVDMVPNVPDAETCQWRCRQDPDCWFFTFNVLNGNCYLKVAGELVEAVAHAISGPKLCP